MHENKIHFFALKLYYALHKWKKDSGGWGFKKTYVIFPSWDCASGPFPAAGPPSPEPSQPESEYPPPEYKMGSATWILETE